MRMEMSIKCIKVSVHKSICDIWYLLNSYFLFISVLWHISLHRKDKSRASSQFRRTSHAQLLKELGSLLPFPDKVVQQIDYNSILRLAICYFQMKSLAIQEGNTSKITSMYLTIMSYNYMHLHSKFFKTKFFRLCAYNHWSRTGMD